MPEEWLRESSAVSRPSYRRERWVEGPWDREARCVHGAATPATHPVSFGRQSARPRGLRGGEVLGASRCGASVGSGRGSGVGRESFFPRLPSKPTSCHLCRAGSPSLVIRFMIFLCRSLQLSESNRNTPSNFSILRFMPKDRWIPKENRKPNFVFFGNDMTPSRR